jgi:hypothetical protein
MMRARLVVPRAGLVYPHAAIGAEDEMKGISWLIAALAVTGAGAAALSCGGSTAKNDATGDDGGASATTGDDGSAAASCTSCKSNGDCGGAICVNLPNGSFCASACDTSAQCSSDTTCTPVESVTNGGQVGACIARGGECGIAASPEAGTPASCGELAGPSTQAACQCPSGRTCNPNGCRYQQYCNTKTNTCQPAPIGCGSAGTGYDGGAPPTGSVNGSGGSLSRLYFAVVGDTRPANEDDTGGYPTAIITQIYQSMQALSPQPTFAIATGDYQFANPAGTQGATQLDLYLGARGKYSGTVFPTMGNHECTGLTNSNCGQGNPDGITNNFTAFQQKMLAPVGQTDPNYEIDVDAADGSWTAKLLFVAGNYWNQDKANWLDKAMSRATTYTFLVRHESLSASTAPAVGPAENIMANHPYTLSITGHTHTYQHSGAREIIVGNGGAPLSGGADYGFAMLSQQADGSIAVDMIDYSTGLADPSFHFAVKPDGSSAQ